MTRDVLELFTRSLRVGLIGLGLAACGGAGDGSGDEPSASLAMPAPETIATLMADDGSIMPASPGAIPDDSGAHTRTGRYASARQAEQFEHARGEAVLPVNVDCCGVDAADQALRIAHSMQATHDLPNSTPVLVRSLDLRLGAFVANRLSDAGYSHVWLVTQ